MDSSNNVIMNSFTIKVKKPNKKLVEKMRKKLSKGLTEKQMAVDRVFQPDKNGVSNWVSRDELNSVKELNWGNNGIGRHGVYFGDNRYHWEKKGGRRIEALRTSGFSESKLHGASRPIRKDIDKYHKTVGCVVCGSKSQLVTDHKNDLYNDMRVLDVKTQTVDDFQCLCNHCNLQKRQVAKKTRETGKRYGATNIPQLAHFGVDFILGDSEYDKDDVDAMVGTYWYDPVAFMKHIVETIATK